MKTNICDSCETVAHCSNNGCIGYSGGTKVADAKTQTAVDKLIEEWRSEEPDWEGIAADQAMTIAMLRVEIDELKSAQELNPAELAKQGWQVVECPICGDSARAFPKPNQEPVAWGCVDEDDGTLCGIFEYEQPPHYVVPLYTAPQPTIPPGYKLVPVEPTPEMLEMGRWLEYPESESRMQPVRMEDVRGVWKAMLAASPEAPQPKREPLTDEEIHDCFQQRNRDKTIERRLIARAIEDRIRSKT